jgi:phosphinothricin acetyltransferase
MPPSRPSRRTGRSSTAAALAHSRLVAVENDSLVGWAALSPTSARACYAGVVEHSVYVAEHARGRGVGQVLMDALVVTAAEHGIWTIQTSIFPENAASLSLHERVGFRVVAAASASPSSAECGGTRSSSSSGSS